LTTFHDSTVIAQNEGLKDLAEYTVHKLGAHPIGRSALNLYAFRGHAPEDTAVLETSFDGLTFEHPVGLAAGWDKKARAAHGLHALGFSAVEVGTVTLRPQPGNAKPRLRTFGRDHAVSLNHFGFNNPGAKIAHDNLIDMQPHPCPIGVSIGKNKTTKLADSAAELACTAALLAPVASYIAFNPSSPNTENLRSIQLKKPLQEHVQAIQSSIDSTPLYIKLAPDIRYAELDDAIEVCLQEGANGLILCNTTSSDKIKQKYGCADEPGGLSGDDVDYKKMCVSLCRYAYEQVGDQITIIGSGAISTAEHAIERITSGASLLQIMTGMRQYKGRVAANIVRGLATWCSRENTTISQAVGSATRRGVIGSS
jgi:dihydroorotate dehydrogenase